MNETKLQKIKDYIFNSTLEPNVYNPWVEGFLCGLVLMPEWGITGEEYDALMVWMQKGITNPEGGETSNENTH